MSSIPSLRARIATADPVLLGLALFTMVWAIIRALVQSISIDEAATYGLYLRFQDTTLWWPGSNNHLLNTMGMRLTTQLMGPSEISMRLPALLGAALYISAWYRLLHAVGIHVTPQDKPLPAASRLALVSLFVCAVCNPFVFDFLVVARGYALALGFLMTAISVIAVWRLRGGESPVLPRAVLVSCAIALSFAANFAFAFACAFTWGALFYWTWKSTAVSRIRLATAFILPATVLTLALPMPLVWTWPEGELWYGATSWTQMLNTFQEILTTRLNREFVNAIVFRLFHSLEPFLIPAALLLSAVWAFVFRARKGSQSSIPLQLSAVLGFAAAATLLAHAIAFYGFGLLLPIGRTGIYLVPLVFGAVMLPLALALPDTGWGLRLLRRTALTAQITLAVFFLLCLRISYFGEWFWDADAKDAFRAVSCLHEQYGVDRVATGWPYTPVFNFYRDTVNGDTIQKVEDERTHPEENQDIQLWVLNAVHTPDPMFRQGLTILTHNVFTQTQLAASPELAERIGSSPCLALHVRPFP